jgi:hypothetical protein
MGPLAILLLLRLLVVASGFSAKESTFASFGTFRSVVPMMAHPPVGSSKKRNEAKNMISQTDDLLSPSPTIFSIGQDQRKKERECSSGRLVLAANHFLE